jgi:hypothetical protein
MGIWVAIFLLSLAGFADRYFRQKLVDAVVQKYRYCSDDARQLRKIDSDKDAGDKSCRTHAQLSMRASRISPTTAVAFCP